MNKQKTPLGVAHSTVLKPALDQFWEFKSVTGCSAGEPLSRVC